MKPSYRFALILAAAACAAGALVAWIHPRPMPDYYMALAGGRDVAAGLLGKPDDWSFITQGRVWIHQNWGSDILLYGTYRGLGENGILSLKALIVAAAAALMVTSSLRRGAALAGALAVVGLVFASWPIGTTIRANLFSLFWVALLTWILLRSHTRPRAIWWAAPVIVLWANMHGAYLLGVGMLGLWAGCLVLQAVARGKEHAPGSAPHAVGALIAAVAGSMFLNPFGISGAVASLALRPGSAWRDVVEWMPLFGGPVETESPWLFVLFSILVATGALYTLIRGRGPLALRVYEAVLTGALVALAFSSRRFVLVAAVALAPIAAHSLVRLVRTPALSAGVLALVVLASVGIKERNLWGYYTSDAEPLQFKDSFLEKMVVRGATFPVGAARFLSDNNVSCPVFHEYQWESYLRWEAPQMKVFMGGRAHQIYDEQEFLKWRDIASADAGFSTEAVRGLGTPVVVVPVDAAYANLIQRLLFEPGSSWACIYADWKSVILADRSTAAGGDLCSRLEAGTLVYVDAGEDALSRGLYLVSPATPSQPNQAYRHLSRGVSMRPVPFAYAQLVTQGLAGAVPPGEIQSLLEAERLRLSDWIQSGDGGGSARRSLAAVDGLLNAAGGPVSR